MDIKSETILTQSLALEQLIPLQKPATAKEYSVT